ncbi:GL25765 [Drosophila persimilis]|uniref:GL25765 n=1 Tax=Drosophila persimilis TaxID=7234 RepID=B4GK13_DROPE|nr:GL25765 [Drosophila persimilis]
MNYGKYLFFVMLVLIPLAIDSLADIGVDQESCFMASDLEDQCGFVCYPIVKPLLQYLARCQEKDSQINQLEEEVRELRVESVKCKSETEALGKQLRNNFCDQKSVLKQALENVQKVQFQLSSELRYLQEDTRHQQTERVDAAVVRKLKIELSSKESLLTDVKSKLIQKYEILEQKEKSIKEKDKLLAEKDEYIKQMMEKYLPRSCETFEGTKGVRTIYVPATEPFSVLCNSIIDGSGWAIVLRELEGSASLDHKLNQYKEKGFGDLHDSFFIGRKNLYLMTREMPHEVFVMLKFLDGSIEVYKGTKVYMGDEEEDYVIKSFNTIPRIGDYSVQQTATELEDQCAAVCYPTVKPLLKYMGICHQKDLHISGMQNQLQDQNEKVTKYKTQVEFLNKKLVDERSSSGLKNDLKETIDKVQNLRLELSEELKKLYRQKNNTVKNQHEEIANVKMQLKRKDEQNEKTMIEKDEIIKQKEKTMEEKDELLKQKKKIMEEKDELLKKKDNTLKNLQEEIANVKMQLKRKDEQNEKTMIEKDEIIKQKEKTMEEKDELLKQKKKIMEEKDELLKKKDNTLKNLQEEIANVKMQLKRKDEQNEKTMIEKDEIIKQKDKTMEEKDELLKKKDSTLKNLQKEIANVKIQLTSKDELLEQKEEQIKKKDQFIRHILDNADPKISETHTIDVPLAEPDESGWTIILQELEGLASLEKKLAQYKEKPFNNGNDSFFIGRKNLYFMAKATPHEILIQVKFVDGRSSSVQDIRFKVGNAEADYTLRSVNDNLPNRKYSITEMKALMAIQVLMKRKM